MKMRLFILPLVFIFLSCDPETMDTFTVTYHGNGNTSGKVPAKVTLDKGTLYKAASRGNLEKTGYSFLYWNTKADGSGTPVNESMYTGASASRSIQDVLEAIVVDGNIDLYAVWGEKKYKVTYYSEGHTSGEAPIDNNLYAEGDYVFLLPHNLKKEGCNFWGWDVSEAAFAPFSLSYTGPIKIDKDITVYACWE